MIDIKLQIQNLSLLKERIYTHLICITYVFNRPSNVKYIEYDC